MSDTPRTDAEALDCWIDEFDSWRSERTPRGAYTSSDFARELERALAKFETAKMPEYPHTVWSENGNAVLQERYDALRTFAAAETVRADEAEKEVAQYQEKADAIHRYLQAKDKTNALLAVLTELSLDAQKRAAIRALQSRKG